MSNDYTATRGVLRRGSIVSTADDSAEQYHKVEGGADEVFEKVLRVQNHGLSSHPPAGSHTLLLAVGGRSDLLVAIGGESGDSRPTALAEGDTKLYNVGGAYVHLEGETITLSAPTSIKLVVGGTVITITGSGVTVDAAAVQINGSSLHHNSKNVGDTHTHGKITVGLDDTDVPN